jgi:hypothetical protein
MKYVITPEQVESLKNNIQTFVDYALNSIRTQSEDWGLGEMDELDEIDSIDKIVVDRIVPYSRLVVYVDIHQNKDRDEYDNTISELQYILEDMFPGIVFHLNEIIGSDN